jgi:hypothetical protein
MLRVTALMSIGLAIAAFIPSADAADNGIYIGAAVSQASVDVDLSNGSTLVPIDGDNTRFKVIAGIRPLDWLAFEVNYVDFGTIDGNAGATSGSYNLKGFDAFAVGLFEIALVDLYGKVGMVRWDQQASISNINLPAYDDSGTDPVYGVGVQLHFGSLSARLEYEMFDIEGSDANMVSLGLTWTFL